MSRRWFEDISSGVHSLYESPVHVITQAPSKSPPRERKQNALLAAAAHDIRQPLQTSRLLNSVLARTVRDDPSAARAVADQAQALDVLAELIASLLDFGALGGAATEPHITDCDVGTVFARLRSVYAPLAAAKGLELAVDAQAAAVSADPVLLSRIVQNLLANAVRYTDQGWIWLRAFDLPDAVRIEVHDTGIGIPAREYHAIFQPLYRMPGTTCRDEHGAGLGLSIAKRLAATLGCSIDVVSSVGRGSRFGFCLPRAPTAPASLPGGPGDLPQGTLALVLDDDPAVAGATAMLLGSAGADVLVAADAAQALECIDSSDRAPALLICDYHLGSGSCVGAIASIRAACGCEIPAIVVSGDRAAAAELTAVGHYRWLDKPIDTDSLLALCAELLGADSSAELETKPRPPCA